MQETGGFSKLLVWPYFVDLSLSYSAFMLKVLLLARLKAPQLAEAVEIERLIEGGRPLVSLIV